MLLQALSSAFWPALIPLLCTALVAAPLLFKSKFSDDMGARVMGFGLYGSFGLAISVITYLMSVIIFWIWGASAHLFWWVMSISCVGCLLLVRRYV